MARLNIPERHRAPLSSIRSLSYESVQQLRSSLDQVAPDLRSSEADQNLSSDPKATLTAVRTLASTKTANLKGVLEVLVTLYEVKSQRNVTVEEFVDMICDAMENLDDPQLRLPSTERAEFAGKLLTLLNAEVFALAAKAEDLATENDHTFCHARILTDLRPVFGPNPEDGPRAALVMHTLKIGYHQQGHENHRSFYVTLDAENLQALKKIVLRAEEKARTLGSIVNNVRLFGVPKEE